MFFFNFFIINKILYVIKELVVNLAAHIVSSFFVFWYISSRHMEIVSISGVVIMDSAILYKLMFIIHNIH